MMYPLITSLLLGVDLFSGHGAQKSTNIEPGALRSIEATIQFAALDQLNSGAATEATLELFPDLALEFEVESVSAAGPVDYEVTLTNPSQPGSIAWFQRKGNIAVGEVYADNEEVHVVIDDTGDGTVEILQSATETGPFCATSSIFVPPCSSTNLCPECFSEGVATELVTLRVLIGFSQQMAAKLGHNLDRVKLRANRMIRMANRIEAASASYVRYELAGAMISSYDEGPSAQRSTDLSTEIDSLVGGTAGLWDLHQHRVTTGAHIVGLVVEGPSPLTAQASGYAAYIGADGSKACFVLRNTLGNGFNTAHEIGHLLGLAHAEECGIVSYARGYYFGPEIAGLPMFGTVMKGPFAFAVSRRSDPGASWPFASPLGWAIGDPASSDEVRLVNETVKYAETWQGSAFGSFEIVGVQGQPLMQVLSTGGIMLRGEVFEEATPGQLAPQLEGGDLVITGPGGSLARIDKATGNLYLKQQTLNMRRPNLTQSVASSPNSYCFVLRDSQGSVVFALSADGYLRKTAVLTENYPGPWL